jgi:AraC family transcriptional regulator of adaptative response/methylated-DNA-[protein]-cysteine methyltransferase
LEFGDRKGCDLHIESVKKLFNAQLLPGSNKHLDTLKIQLSEFFEEKRNNFTISLDVAGTPFQQKVWLQLQRIPFGTTRSYQEQAELLGNKNAVRAVARANGQNRIAIVVPCHRVIGKNGSLTGYSGEIWRKKYLLDLEKK